MDVPEVHSIIDLGLDCDVVAWEPVEEPWKPVYQPVYQPIYAPMLGEILQGETGWAMPDADDAMPFLNKKGVQQDWGSYFTYSLVTE